MSVYIYIYIFIIVSPVSVYVLTRKNGRAYGYTRNYAKCVVTYLVETEKLGKKKLHSSSSWDSSSGDAAV